MLEYYWISIGTFFSVKDSTTQAYEGNQIFFQQQLGNLNHTF